MSYPCHNVMSKYSVVCQLTFDAKSHVLLMLREKPCESIVEKGENAGYQHFVLFPQYFHPFLRQLSQSELQTICYLQFLFILMHLKFCRLESVAVKVKLCHKLTCKKAFVDSQNKHVYIGWQSQLLVIQYRLVTSIFSISKKVGFDCSMVRHHIVIIFLSFALHIFVNFRKIELLLCYKQVLLSLQCFPYS